MMAVIWISALNHHDGVAQITVRSIDLNDMVVDNREDLDKITTLEAKSHTPMRSSMLKNIRRLTRAQDLALKKLLKRKRAA